MITCFKCHKIFEGPESIRKLFRHLRILHTLFDGKNLVLSCGQGDCPLIYGSFSSLRKHLITKHENVKTLHIENISEGRIEDNDNCINSSDLEKESQETFESDCESDSNADIFSQIEKQAALFIASMLADNLTYTSVSNVINLCSDLLESLLCPVISKMKKISESLGLKDDSSITDISGLLELCKNPFINLKTRHKQEKYFASNFDEIKPETIRLGTRFETINCKQAVVSDTYQYISLIETLKMIFKNEQAKRLLTVSHSSMDGKMRNFCDGTHFNSHQLFLQDKDALQICLYFDEIEVTNPIGSRRGVHKLGQLYFLIKNFPPIYNSQLSNIHLLASFYSVDLKKYGFSQILEEFMKELAQLESDKGVELYSEAGKPMYRRACLVQVSGDNLGQNDILGFVCGFTANRPCRNCLVTRPEIQISHTDESFEKRTITNYNAHLESLVTETSTASDHGIKKECILNYSRYFHVTENYNPDIMHDILEGIAGVEIKLLLNQLIYVDKFFSLDILNGRMHSFTYSLQEKHNKPTQITVLMIKNKDTLLKQKASQMWCLIRILPFLIGDLVPQDNEHWFLFLLLRKIIDNCFARCVTVGMCHILTYLIKDHHCLFKKLYNSNLSPKHHFMTHYPDMMLKIGPLSNCWSMRFEGKHIYAKKLANIVYCFKDICLTLATRHQYSHCIQWATGRGLKSSFELADSNVIPSLVKYIDGYNILLDRESSLSPYDEIYIANKVKLNGITYQVNMVIPLKSSEFDLPLFGLIEKILLIGETVYFQGIQYKATHFAEHYHAFSVCLCPGYFICQLADFADFYPLGLYKTRDETDSNIYVILKYEI